MPRRTKPSPEPSESPGEIDRSAYGARFASGFEQSLNRLGVQAADMITVELQEFMTDYRANMSPDELRSVWDYKQLVGKELRRWKVDQIRVATHYRVALTVMHSVQALWFLNVYRRHSDRNSPDIALAVTRARRVRES
jgi:hypothetical protein